MNIWNNVSQSQPRDSLIYALQDETKQIHNLETENSELQSTIKSYQDFLAIIMKKYREQSTDFEQTIKFETDYNAPSGNLTSQRCEYFQQRLNEMILVLDKAQEIDETKISKQEKQIAELKNQNDKIKKLLKIKR